MSGTDNVPTCTNAEIIERIRCQTHLGHTHPCPWQRIREWVAEQEQT